MPNSSLYEVNDGQVEESNFTNQMIASVGPGIAGMKTQAGRLQKEFQQFENDSKYVGEATKGIKGDRLITILTLIRSNCIRRKISQSY